MAGTNQVEGLADGLDQEAPALLAAVFGPGGAHDLGLAARAASMFDQVGKDVRLRWPDRDRGAAAVAEPAGLRPHSQAGDLPAAGWIGRIEGE